MAGMEALLGDLEAARRSLLSHWHATQGAWNDPVSEGFMTEYIQPLDNECRAMEAEMAKAFQIISTARRTFGIR